MNVLVRNDVSSLKHFLYYTVHAVPRNSSDFVKFLVTCTNTVATVCLHS